MGPRRQLELDAGLGFYPDVEGVFDFAHLRNEVRQRGHLRRGVASRDDDVLVGPFGDSAKANAARETLAANKVDSMLLKRQTR